MFLSSILLAICVSIDSLGIGLTYGLKNTKISSIAKLILFIICLVVTGLSVAIGNYISQIFTPDISKIIGATFLCILGAWIIIQSITDKSKSNDFNNDTNKRLDNSNRNIKDKKEYQFFIKFLGITIQIIKDPSYSDLDKSNKIDGKEAMYLGIALSLDSIGIGIGSSIMTSNLFLFPLLASIFQLLFLSVGSFLGKKIRDISNIPQNIWSIISGALLIFIGFSKIIF